MADPFAEVAEGFVGVVVTRRAASKASFFVLSFPFEAETLDFFVGVITIVGFALPLPLSAAVAVGEMLTTLLDRLEGLFSDTEPVWSSMSSSRRAFALPDAFPEASSSTRLNRAERVGVVVLFTAFEVDADIVVDARLEVRVADFVGVVLWGSSSLSNEVASAVLFLAEPACTVSSEYYT